MPNLNHQQVPNATGPKYSASYNPSSSKTPTSGSATRVAFKLVHC